MDLPGQSKVLPSDLCDEQDWPDHHWRTRHYCRGSLPKMKCECLLKSEAANRLHSPCFDVRCHIMFPFVRITNGISTVWSRWCGDIWVFWGGRLGCQHCNICQQDPTRDRRWICWSLFGVCRIYTKPRGQIPDYTVGLAALQKHAKAIFWNPAIFQCKSLARLQWSSLQRRIRLRTFCTVQVICWSLQQNQENDCKIDLGQAFIFTDNSRTSVFEFTSLCWDSRGHRSFIAKLSHWAPFNSSNDAWPQVQGCSGVGNVRGPCLFWKKQRTQLTQYTQLPIERIAGSTEKQLLALEPDKSKMFSDKYGWPVAHQK